MELEILNDITKIGAIKDEWNSLALASTNPSVFSTYEFILTSWQWFDVGNSQLQVLTMRNEGRLVGLLPLRTRRHRVGAAVETVVEYAGMTGGDRPYILARPQHEGTVWQTALRALDLMHWDRLSFQNLPEISPGRLALEHHFRDANRYDVSCEPSGSAAILDLDLACKKQPSPERSECTQVCGRFFDRFPRAKLTHFDSGSNIDQAIEKFLSLSTSDKVVAPSLFTESRQHIEFFQALMRRLVGNGWTEIHTLEQDGEILAAGLTHTFEKNATFHETIWSSEHQAAQPGAYLTVQVLERLRSQSTKRLESVVTHSHHMWPWARGQVSTVNLGVGNRTWKSALRRSPLASITPTGRRVHSSGEKAKTPTSS